MQQKIKHLASWFITAVLFTTSVIGNVALAATFYVATNGNDANPGTFEAPFLSIDHVWRVVRPGDTIEVRGGTYPGAWILPPSNPVPGAWITLKPYNGEAVTITAAGNPGGISRALAFSDPICILNDTPDANGNPVPDTCRARDMYWSVEGLTLIGNAGQGNVVKIDTPRVRLINNNLSGSFSEIVKLVRTADDVEIRGNEIHHNTGGGAMGIDIVGADRTQITNNYIHHIFNIGIFAKGNSRNTLIEFNRLENIENRGIMLGNLTGKQFMKDGPYETYDGIVRNNIIINTWGPCLGAASSWNARIYNNSCYNAATNAHAAIFISKESQWNQGNTHVEIKNNLIVASPSLAWALKVATGGMSDNSTLHVDNNLYWTPDGIGTVYFAWEDFPNFWARTYEQWRTLSAQNGFPQDVHSRDVDPQLTSLTNLTIGANSPAVDMGDNNPAVCAPTDFNHNPRPRDGNGDGAAVCDAGAYEVAGGPPPVDTMPPSVSFSSPQAGATVAGVINVTANATDNVAVKSVQFFQGGLAIGNPVTAPPYSAAFDTRTVSNGSLSFTAQAIDTSDNSATSNPVSVIVANGCPTVTGGPNAAWKWNNTPIPAQTGVFTAEWDATPFNSGEDTLISLTSGPQTFWDNLSLTVRFNINNTIDAINNSTSVYNADAVVPYSPNVSYHFRVLVDLASHRYTVYVTPAGGGEILLANNYAFRSTQQTVTSLNNLNLGSSAGSLQVCGINVHSDTDVTPPTVSMTAPGQGATVSSQVTLAAQASDNVAVAGVQFLVDGLAAGSEDIAGPYSLPFNTAGLADGTHQFAARARDAAGNTATSTSVSGTVANTCDVASAASGGPWQWRNTAFASQTGTFALEWDAAPLNSGVDGLMSLTLGPQTFWDNLAVTVRFNINNTIDAINNSTSVYAADTVVPYVPNTGYHFRVVVNLVSHTYSVYVTPSGGIETLLASNYGFRSTQQSVASLNNFNLGVGFGSVKACNIAVTASAGAGTPPPTVRIEENDTRLVYAATNPWEWNGATTPNASGGAFIGSGTVNSSLQLRFSGTGIKWISLRDQYAGQARVTLDGVITNLDNYRPCCSAEFGWQQNVYERTGLANTEHVMRIDVLGTKNPSSLGTGVAVDAFDIMGTLLP